MRRNASALVALLGLLILLPTPLLAAGRPEEDPAERERRETENGQRAVEDAEAVTAQVIRKNGWKLSEAETETLNTMAAGASLHRARRVVFRKSWGFFTSLTPDGKVLAAALEGFQPALARFRPNLEARDVDRMLLQEVQFRLFVTEAIHVEQGGELHLKDAATVSRVAIDILKDVIVLDLQHLQRADGGLETLLAEFEQDAPRLAQIRLAHSALSRRIEWLRWYAATYLGGQQPWLEDADVARVIDDYEAITRRLGGSTPVEAGTEPRAAGVLGS